MSASPSRSDVKTLLVSMFPVGSEQLYDFSNSAYIGGSTNALAGALKETLTDRIAALRRETNPATIEENLPEWEQACGLAYTPIALYGTTAQRQHAVLAVLRMSGSFSLDDIRAIIQPYFLYQDPSQIEIIETSRVVFTTLHTYTNSSPVTVAMGVTGSSTVSIADDPRVSPAGAIVTVTITTTRADGMYFALEAPDGRRIVYQPYWLSETPLSVTTQAFKLYAKGMAGAKILGSWTLRFGCVFDSVTLDGWSLFVEGLGVIYDGSVPPNRIGEGLGAGIFEFAVVADPAQLGAGYDLEGAQRALTRWKPAHTQGAIVPLSALGTVCAIPDTPNAIPDRAIPC